MNYPKKGGGRRQRELLALLAEYSGRPLAAWWIAERRGEAVRRVCRSLKRLAERGVVLRHGARRNYTWSLAGRESKPNPERGALCRAERLPS